MNAPAIIAASKTRFAQRGFTLLELLVAIAIFALMSAMAYGGLNSALNTRDHADGQAERLAELQKAMTILERDIEQAIARPVRDNYGDSAPAMSGSGYGSSILEFTRSGRPNPMQQPRSHLQRVGYLLQEDRLLRQAWPVLDRSLATEAYEAELLLQVKGIELRFLDAGKEWQSEWPQPTFNNAASEAQSPPAMPLAVEITLELEDWGRIRRIFSVAGGA